MAIVIILIASNASKTLLLKLQTEIFSKTLYIKSISTKLSLSDLSSIIATGLRAKL